MPRKDSQVVSPFDLIRGLGRKDNPFRDMTAEEKKKFKETEKSVKEGVKQLGLICNDILNDQRYVQFADLFRDIEKQVIELMIDLEESDQNKFFVRMKEYQHRLRDFRNILKMPHQFVERADDIRKEEAKNRSEVK